MQRIAFERVCGRDMANGARIGLLKSGVPFEQASARSCGHAAPSRPSIKSTVARSLGQAEARRTCRKQQRGETVTWARRHGGSSEAEPLSTIQGALEGCLARPLPTWLSLNGSRTQLARNHGGQHRTAVATTRRRRARSRGLTRAAQAQRGALESSPRARLLQRDAVQDRRKRAGSEEHRAEARQTPTLLNPSRSPCRTGRSLSAALGAGCRSAPKRNGGNRQSTAPR